MSKELDFYIKATEKQIKELKDLICLDRMDLQAGLEECIQHINASTLGWAKWLGSAKIMKNFTDTELKSYFERMKIIAADFLALDIEASKLFLEKQKEKEEKEAKPVEGTKSSYVA